jgi:hypothetical protein
MATKLPVLIIALSAALLAGGGCRDTRGVDDGAYTHRGLGFSIAVPEGWTVTELDGDLAVRLEGPISGDRLRPVAHVFCRDDYETVDLDAVAQKLYRLMRIEAALPIEDEDEDSKPSSVAEAPADDSGAEVRLADVTIGGKPGRRITRTVKVRAAALEEEMLIVALGNRVRALVIDIPESADAATRAAAEQVKASFKVW